jgi:hypothetical protein
VHGVEPEGGFMRGSQWLARAQSSKTGMVNPSRDDMWFKFGESNM